MKWFRTFFVLTVISLWACSSAYYGAMEKLGVHKRDIMVDVTPQTGAKTSKVVELFSSCALNTTSPESATQH